MVEITITINIKADNMASLDNATAAVDALRMLLDTKVPEIEAAIAGAAPTQADVDALASSIDNERMRVEAIQTTPVVPQE